MVTSGVSTLRGYPFVPAVRSTPSTSPALTSCPSGTVAPAPDYFRVLVPSAMRSEVLPSPCIASMPIPFPLFPNLWEVTPDTTRLTDIPPDLPVVLGFFHLSFILAWRTLLPLWHEIVSLWSSVLCRCTQLSWCPSCLAGAPLYSAGTPTLEFRFHQS